MSSENIINVNVSTPSGIRKEELPEGATMEDVKKLVEESVSDQIGDLSFRLNSETVKDFLKKVEDGDVVTVAPEKLEGAKC